MKLCSIFLCVFERGNWNSMLQRLSFYHAQKTQKFHIHHSAHECLNPFHDFSGNKWANGVAPVMLSIAIKKFKRYQQNLQS